MNILIEKSKMITNLKLILAFLLFISTAHVIHAQVTVTKSELNGLTSKQVDQPFTYVINYSTPNTSTSYTNLQICDQLPQGLVFLGVSPATGDMQSLSYNSSTNSVCAVFNSPWNGGTGQFQIVVKFDPNVFNGTVASNTATVTSNQYNGTSNTVNITAISDKTPPALTNTCTVSTNADIASVTNGGLMLYRMIYGIGGANATTSFTVIDDLPKGFILGSVTGGQYYGTNVNYTVYYQTNTNTTWVAFPGTPVNTANYTALVPPSFASGTYITKIKVELPALPAGALFTTANFSGLNLSGYFDNNIGGFSNGASMSNCISASTTGSSSSTCGPVCEYTTYTTTQRYETALGKHKIDWNNDVEVGKTYRYEINFGEGYYNAANIVNPVVTDLLPPEFIYVGNPTVTDAFLSTSYANAGSPVPTFEVIPNYAGTGRTLLRWSWGASNPFTIVRSGVFPQRLAFQFDVSIRSVPTGVYQNDAYGSATGGTPDDCSGLNYPSNSVVDTNDMDKDGSTTDYICHTYQQVNIINPSGAALVSEKWVKGSLDTGYSRYPASGKTTPGGIADYKLKLKNAGTVALKNIKIIDIFPYVGDRGVIDLSARGSEWKPMFVGPVTGPAGATVYYSTSYDPCRTDLNFTASGCDASAVWTTTLPADITTVHSIKIDLGSIVMQPNDILEFNWPMRAPIDAPTNGEIAWNSFGYTATRNDNNSVLPSSEPIKVGISVNPIQPAAYGNYVWYDANGDGLQNEPAANGINGVKVDLYWAKGATANIATDSLVTFTITSSNAGNPGYYLFPVLNPGNYYAVFHKPINNLKITTPNVGSDNTINSDGIQTIISGDTLAITAITNLTASETDYTWDLGLSPACTPPSGKGYGEEATCSGATPNNDAKINLYSLTNATKYGYSLGSTYTGASYTSATSVSGATALISGLAGSNTQKIYTIRLFNGGDACYDDIQIILPAPACNIDCKINGGPDQMICSPANTADLPDAGSNQEWILGSINASGSATINASTGLVSSMTADGIYSFILQDKTNNTCKDEVYVFRGSMELPFITSCTSTTELPTASGISWSSVSGGATVTASGMVSGMNTNGHYVFSANLGGCSVTITVEKITCSCVKPTSGTPSVLLGTCLGSSLNNDASVTVGSIVNGDKASISTAGATSFDGSAYSSASAVTNGSITFSGLQHGKNYIVRIYNGLTNGLTDCYTDVNVTIGTKSCCPSPNCGTVTVLKN